MIHPLAWRTTRLNFADWLYCLNMILDFKVYCGEHVMRTIDGCYVHNVNLDLSTLPFYVIEMY